MDRRAWWATVHGVAKRVGHDRVSTHVLVDPDFGLQWLQTSQKGRPADTKGFMTEEQNMALKLPED